MTRLTGLTTLFMFISYYVTCCRFTSVVLGFTCLLAQFYILSDYTSFVPARISSLPVRMPLFPCPIAFILNCIILYFVR